jgi:glycine/D-amino acid oxidase-like deaminating enzyme
MQKSYIIVGHGLSGCVLALTFFQRGIPFKWIGSTKPGEASLVSSGLITPITGRKYVKSWMIDEFLDSAIEFYQYSEGILGKKYFHPAEIIRFLSNDEAKAAWRKRLGESEYKRFISSKSIESLDSMERQYGIVTGAYQLQAAEWIRDVRTFFSEKEILKEELYDDELKGNIDVVIYATGAVGWEIPDGIIPNKGEALLVSLSEWPYPAILKNEIYFVPSGIQGQFWIGSYYEPWPEFTEPTAAGKQRLIKALLDIYDGPYTILDHMAGVRPTVKDRRPIIGPWRNNPAKYWFNGMGTKGTSLAPYWAVQLADHFELKKELPPIVLPSRFDSQLSG